MRGIGATVDERRCFLREKQEVDADGTESEDTANVEGTAAVSFEFRRPKGRREDFGDGGSGSASSSVRVVECTTPKLILGLLAALPPLESLKSER